MSPDELFYVIAASSRNLLQYRGQYQHHEDSGKTPTDSVIAGVCLRVPALLRGK